MTKTYTKTNTKIRTVTKTDDWLVTFETDYNYDNWEPEFMTIFVTWQLRVTLDSGPGQHSQFLQCLVFTTISPYPWKLLIIWDNLWTSQTMSICKARSLQFYKQNCDSTFKNKYFKSLDFWHFPYPFQCHSPGPFIRLKNMRVIKLMARTSWNTIVRCL